MTDPSADPRRFDPRFDPAFQPGYDPRNDPAAPARADLRRFDAAPPTQLTPPDHVAPSRYPSAPQAAAPAHRSATGSTDDDDESAVLEVFEEHQATDDAASARGVNPFTVTLWVLSVVLIAAGITVFRSIPGLEQQGSFSTGSGTPTSYSQILSLSVLGPILIGLGVLVAIGNVFVLAGARLRRST